MRSRISRSLWQRFFFAAVAATTIRAILPFSLRLCEYFSYFQKLAYLLPFSLETARYALVANALHYKIAFSATPESEDSLAVEN